MKLSCWKFLIALLPPCIAIYWMVAGHDLRYTLNPGPGEYEEDFATPARIIISCLEGIIWAVALTIVFVIGRRIYQALTSLLASNPWACPDLLDRDFLNFFMDVRAFEVHRGLIVQSAVEPFWIIKGFDVVKDGQVSGTTG